MHLNPAQTRAVQHTNGPLLIVAGAGTGKTRTLTHRIVRLIKDGIPPERILAITFTNKAAKEMRERVRHLIENDPEINRPVSALATGMSLPFMSTFHSLGVTLLREFGTFIGIKRHFTIYDRDDSVRTVKQVLTDMGLDPKEHDPRSLLGTISSTKGDNRTYEYLTRQTDNPWKTLAGDVMRRYDEKLREEGALDFDDLLAKTVMLLKTVPEIRELLHKRWTYIHIDEYQDTNAIQFEITKMLVGSENNICAVGDSDQLVYGWRGAKIENILSFEKEFPNTTVILLEENYRSTKNIITAANAIIEKNKLRTPKNLFTSLPDGEKISLALSFSGEDEARSIARHAQQLIEDAVAPHEIAVLYRVNFLSRTLEEAFLRTGIPYQVLGTRFFERAEVKDVLSYLKAALNPQSPGDIARACSTPTRGIGKSTLAKMLMHEVASLPAATQKKVGDFYALLERIKTMAETEAPSRTLIFIIKESGLEKLYRDSGTEGQEHLENVRELVTLSTKYDEMTPQEGIEKLLEDVALASDQDSLDNARTKQSSVKLMTIHAAKGLEFEHVFLPGLEQGLFPHERMDESSDTEEERRLMYVAVTRARKQLYVSYAMTRTMYGSQKVTLPSEFLSDIPADVLETVENSHATSSSRGKIDLIDF